MKKTSILLLAATLAAGSTAALAQTRDEGRAMHDADTTRSAPHTPRKAENKVGNAMHRLGDKTRSAMHRMGNAMHARKDDADDRRAMGGPGDPRVAGTPGDRAQDIERDRRDRMDRAYANWKNRQPDARTGEVERYNPHEDRDERGAAAR